MVAVISFVTVLALSLLVVHVGTVALTMTGLSREIAAFQALSAFSGAGFTTDEATEVVSTPIRRKVISLLIRLGNLGVVTALSSLLFSLLHIDDMLSPRLLVLLIGPLFLIFLSRSRRFDRWLTRVVRQVLHRYTSVALYDYNHLLHLQDGYGVGKVSVTSDSWLSSQPLKQLELPSEGLVLLGLVRSDGSYTGVPSLDTRLEVGQEVILYGHREVLQDIKQRKADIPS